MARSPELPCPDSPSGTLLDAVLQNLYDFGETEDGAKQKRVRKKRESRKGDGGPPAAKAPEPAPPPGAFVRGQRKGALSFFTELREELRAAPVVPASSAATGPQAPQTAAPPRKQQVEVVEFHSRSAKRRRTPGGDGSTETKTSILEKDVDVQEFNLEKARLEVHRFGITGYGKGKERCLERERAIMLGAKPPKKSYINYKVLQEQIKEKKAAKEEEERMAHVTDIFKKRRKGQEDRKSRKKKSAPSILSSGRVGQVGKFKNGTLILSPVDIKKINSSRVAK